MRKRQPMNKINYQKQLDKVIENLGETKPTLLLHSCCAPCSSYVMEYLSQYFDITIDYYNPNIDSKEEYEKRRNAKQVSSAASGKLGAFYISLVYHAVIRA